MTVSWVKNGMIVYHENKRCIIRPEKIGYKLTVQSRVLWFWFNKKRTAFEGDVKDSFDVIQYAKNYIVGETKGKN